MAAAADAKRRRAKNIKVEDLGDDEVKESAIHRLTSMISAAYEREHQILEEKRRKEAAFLADIEERERRFRAEYDLDDY